MAHSRMNPKDFNHYRRAGVNEIACIQGCYFQIISIPYISFTCIYHVFICVYNILTHMCMSYTHTHVYHIHTHVSIIYSHKCVYHIFTHTNVCIINSHTQMMGNPMNTCLERTHRCDHSGCLRRLPLKTSVEFYTAETFCILVNTRAKFSITISHSRPGQCLFC